MKKLNPNVAKMEKKNELTTAVQTPPETNSRNMERPPDLPEENLIYTKAGRVMKKPKRYQDN